jgi:hypothetical protein
MSPTDRTQLPWPYGWPTALVAVPTVWVLLLLMPSITERWLAWPEPGARAIVVYCALAFSVASLAFALLHVLATGLPRSRAGRSTRQNGALAQIERDRVAYEDMVWRAARASANAAIDGRGDRRSDGEPGPVLCRRADRVEPPSPMPGAGVDRLAAMPNGPPGRDRVVADDVATSIAPLPNKEHHHGRCD